MASGSQLFNSPPFPITPLVSPLWMAVGKAQRKDSGSQSTQISPRASRLRLMLLASSISSPRDPVAATFSLPARSTKHSFPPAGGSLGSTGGICWGWRIRALWGLGRGCRHQSHRAKGFHHNLPCTPSWFIHPEADPCWVALGCSFPSWGTHSLVADVECEQGMASAGGLVQGVSGAPSTAKT